MTRVSIAEMYDDKDVITQICKLKDTVNAYAGGIITDIEISGNDLVIEWADGESTSLPLPDPVTGISSITGSVAGGNLTITFYFTNGTTHSFTCPLNGMASESYVDTKDAQNVKLTGAQSVAGVKTFTDSPNVPTTPASPTGAVNEVYVNNPAAGVNNLLHKTGAQKKSGRLTETDDYAVEAAYQYPPGVTSYTSGYVFVDTVGEPIGNINHITYANGRTAVYVIVRNSDGTSKSVIIAEGDTI